MARFARAAGSSNAFTLVEVMIAVSLLATAATAVITIYIRDVKQAGAAKDLTIGSSIARNALNEGLADYTKTTEPANYFRRPSLSVAYENGESKEEHPLTKDVKVKVKEVDRGEIVSYIAKKAVYELPEQVNQPDANGQPSPNGQTNTNGQPNQPPANPSGGNFIGSDGKPTGVSI